MKYRDYFSLKTLHRFGVEPDRVMNTEGEPEQIKNNIMSAFGTNDAKDLEYLSHKTDCALIDMRITEPAPEKERIEVKEAFDDFIPSEELTFANDHEQVRDRTL